MIHLHTKKNSYEHIHFLSALYSIYSYHQVCLLLLVFQGECALAEEVERLQERKSQLQKCNLRLEAENLELKLQLERLRTSDTSSTPRDPM